jgi:hypothetical protein
MSEKQEAELQRYKQLMQEAEDRKDEIGITSLRREIDRMLREMRDNPDKP